MNGTDKKDEVLFESEVFVLPRQKMLSRLRRRYGRGAIVAASVAVTVLAAAGVLYRDPRIPVAGLMFLFLGWSVLTSFLYISHAITKAMLLNTTPHRILVSSSGIIVSRQPDTITEEDGTERTISHNPVFFPYSAFSGYRVGLQALTLLFPEPGTKRREGFLYIPYEALPTGAADRLIAILKGKSVRTATS